ncbi:hypothetical protein F4777DRAFT_576714 [Nemania sp. FL0916]|nr:hypothetical protein F4777DRAFT_576714 [Nemania sp. FL0916]
MADLRYILDPADEELEDDKYSQQPGVSGSARNLNPSSTAPASESNLPPSSSTDPGKPQPRRRGPLSRPTRSTGTVLPATAAANVDKGSPSRSSRIERRSVDSTESIDPVSYESYTHSSSSSNMPPSGSATVSSRTMANVPGESDTLVRLTPVTRRTFTRAEHLSEQDDRPVTDAPGSTSRRPSHPPAERAGGLHPPMVPGSGMSMTDEMSASTSYPGSASPYSASPGESISEQGPISPSTHTSRPHSTTPSHSPDEYILSSTHHVAPFGIHNMGGSPYTPPYFQPRRAPSFGFITTTDGPPSLIIPDNSFPGHISRESNWPSSGSGSPYSTPDRAAIRGYESPNADVHNPEMVFLSSPNQYPSPQQPVYHQIQDFHNPPYTDETAYFELQSHTFPVRSPTPPTVTLSTQPAANLVTLGSSVPDPSAVLSRQKGSAAFLSPYSNAALLTALVPSPAALNAIPHYIDIYWKRFDTALPLVHRRSLETSNDPVLQCAMAAMGSQFLHSKEDRINSHILHSFASQEARRRPQWGLDVMQAILLCEFYNRFRGSRAVYRASEPFQSLYSRVATSELSPNYDTSANTNSNFRHWDHWIDAESRRRLLAACFVLDAHTSMYHEHPVLHDFFSSTPQIPLTKSTQRLWEAEGPDAWVALLGAEPTQLNPVYLADEEIITPDTVETAPPLDRAVYLASETLRLKQRSSSSSVSTTLPADVDADSDSDPTSRIRNLFPSSAVANTYLALHHTPLRDLLAVSGDSWLFSRKILSAAEFERRKASVRQWTGTTQAGAASTFAAKALSLYLDPSYSLPLPDTTPAAVESSSQQQGLEWHMSDISDYWALYVCALICWSLGQRTPRGTTTTTTSASCNNSTSSSGAEASDDESEARIWLSFVAGLSPASAVQNVRGRRGGSALGVVALVRRRLEAEIAGGKSKLLTDAARVLKALEDDPTRPRF